MTSARRPTCQRLISLALIISLRRTFFVDSKRLITQADDESLI